MTFQTEQEAFWAGEFGTEYVGRNRDDLYVAGNLHLFSKALARARDLHSCIEFGPNIGLNLRALQMLYPGQEQHAVEINNDAAAILARYIPAQNVVQQSILDYRPSRVFDLALIKGVLIHLHPDALPAVYDKLHAVTGRFLLVAEYYNPTPVAIPYRGHSDRLFKRDFAGEILARHRDLQLVDYGFAYHLDPQHPQDDLTWFLMERT